MIKLTVEQVISSIEMLSATEKDELVARLTTVLSGQNWVNQPEKGQSMTNTLGDVQLSGGNSTFNFQPEQGGRDVNTSTTFAQGSSGHRELLQALSSLQKAIRTSEALPELSKIGAENQVEQLADEAKKDNPDQNLIGRTVLALKQGLQGVQDLAGPVMAVASIVAKVWSIPV